MQFDFNHLKTAKIHYFGHGYRVSKISIKLILLAIAGVIHALLPFVLVETVSKGVKKIEDELSSF